MRFAAACGSSAPVSPRPTASSSTASRLAHPGAKVAPHDGQIRYAEESKTNSQQRA